jgi:protein SCO1/2
MRRAGWLRRLRPCTFVAFAIGSLLLAAAARGAARPELRGPLPPGPEEISVDERPGAQVPADLLLRDQEGRAFRLGDRLGGRPLLLVLAYYRCPMLCDLVLRGLAQAVAQLGWQPGRELDALTVSIDPKDTPAAARLKQGHVLQVLGRPESAAGWPFTVADEASVRRLADRIGVHYVHDERSDQYAHPAVALVLTPDGRVSRYVYGVTFRPFDLRLALTEAGGGQIGARGAVDHVLLTCFRYDPSARRYGFYVLGLLKGGGLLVLLLGGAGLFVLIRRDRARQRGAGQPQPGAPW